MATGDQVQAAEQSVERVKMSLLSAIGTGHAISHAHAAQVHRTIDLLRAAGGEPGRLARVEGISRMMHPLPHLLREGRVNAYASAVLRLQRAAHDL